MPTEGTLGREETYRALHESVVAHLGERDAVKVVGPSAFSYLQGQCSQDLAPLGDGDTAWSLLLTPQGKIVALVRVTRREAEHYLLDVAPGWGEAVFERLRRFKVRVKAELTPARLGCLELRGPASREMAKGSASSEVLLVPVDWHGLMGVDLLAPEAPRLAGVPEGDPRAFEAARIEAGLPAMGSELDASTIPQSAGVVEAAVSFTKGCYTGQELVARLDARHARAPQILRGIEVVATPSEALAMPEPGDPLILGERRVGALTSVAFSPRTGSAVALAYVRREVEPPVEAAVVSGAGAVQLLVRVAELPLVG